MTLMLHEEVMEITSRVGKAHQGSVTSQKGETPLITADEGARLLQDRTMLIAVLRQVAYAVPEGDRPYLSQGTRQLLLELRIYT